MTVKPKDFETSLKKLEETVKELEEGELTLEQSLERLDPDGQGAARLEIQGGVAAMEYEIPRVQDAILDEEDGQVCIRVATEGEKPQRLAPDALLGGLGDRFVRQRCGRGTLPEVGVPA